MEEEKQVSRTSESYMEKNQALQHGLKNQKSNKHFETGNVFLTEKLSQRQSPASPAFLTETCKNLSLWE